MKTCTRCKKRKRLTSFYSRSKSADGLQSTCKACEVVHRKARYRENPGAAKRAAKVWRRKNTEQYQSKHRAYMRRLRMDALEHYSDGVLACACCGEDEPRFLTLDHTNGGGNAHRKKFSSSSGLFKWLKDKGWPAGFGVLCYNCNCAKGSYGICPHQEIR